ncbi:carboxy-cis,cis-muconate cyclase [Pochonia chlamydosporia 170]|uniref:Carboxy-cis,cis-muconate cyclase n=1 Tax=Pochonia chlamydosporia 170 TaxID=1380566 RepID=A0A179G6T6_METCM|nr:carboxy-cis,cis-muconate cyclase [Pochonia chlamydosporia 170]OAQ73507.1 carboxy-cis,cis-muconate cyclase [Pochonia chlamydosporia 170]
MLTQLLLAAATASALSIPSNNMTGTAKLLLGTPNTISIADFDGTKFSIASKKSFSGNPTWMVFDEGKLYAVDENSATTHLLKVDLAGNKIDEVSTTSGSNGVVHLELTKDKTQMLGAAYGSAAIDVFDTQGGLKYVKSIKSDDQVGPNPTRQDKPHPHQSVMDPSGRFFAVNDLGTDKILILDSQDGFKIVNHVPVQPGGCGPRHGAFHPVGAEKASHYVVLCEIKNLVVTYSLKYGGAKGIEFTEVQSISTFKSQADMPATAAAGELVIAPDNKSVYVSNRLTGGDTDNIAHFRVAGNDFKLEFVGLTSTGGKLPRMFSVSTDGKTLLVGNQDGKLGLVALKRNDDGSLVQAPVASLEMSQFPGEKAGPSFVQQVA